MPPLVSILIPCWNNVDLTRQCIEAIHAHTQDVAHELIVVDNGSTDGTRAYLKSLGGRIRPVWVDHNLKFTGAINLAASQVTGRYLCLLNNDTVPQPGWLSALVRLAETDQRIGVVGSKLLFPDGTIQHVGVAFAEGPFHIYHKQPFAHAPFVNFVRDFQAVTAACQLVRWDVWQMLGGHDPAFPMAFGDMDFCLRVRGGGFRVVYCPQSVVTHYESQTPERFATDAEDFARFAARWKGRFRVDAEAIYRGDGWVVEPGTGRWMWTEQTAKAAAENKKEKAHHATYESRQARPHQRADLRAEGV